MTTGALERFLAPMSTRIRMMVARAVCRAVNDAGGLQAVQVSLLADEVKDGVERVQNYGLTSVPLPGAEGVAVFVGGNRDHGVVIAMDDRRYRLKGLEGGEVALYTLDDQEAHGHRIVLRRGGLIEVFGQDVHLNAAGVLRLEGDGVEVHGRTYVQTDVHGKGQRETHAGGTAYTVDSYTAGASGSSTEHGLAQPALASDLPG